MKIFSLLAILGATHFFATFAQAETVERIEREVILSASTLRCEVIAGQEGAIEDRLNTLLGRNGLSDKLHFGGVEEGDVILEHSIAYSAGCDLEALDKLVQRSRSRFGHLFGVKLTVVRQVSDARINGFGECIETVSEELTFELAPNIKIVSNQAKLRSSDHCE